MQSDQTQSHDDERDRSESSEEGTSNNSNQVEAAREAVKTTSKRLFCFSDAEKLERRRISNRKSARRRRLQEHEEIQGLEEQVRYLSQAKTQLKSEQLKLEQMLDAAMERIQKEAQAVQMNARYHNLDNFNEDKLPVSLKSPPSTTIGGSRVSQFSQLLSESHPGNLVQVAGGQIAGLLPPISLPQVPEAPAHFVRNWGHTDQIIAGGWQSGYPPSSSMPSGGDLLAAIVSGLNKSEAQMYELVSPLAAGNGGSLQLPLPFQSPNLPSGRFAASPSANSIVNPQPHTSNAAFASALMDARLITFPNYPSTVAADEANQSFMTYSRTEHNPTDSARYSDYCQGGDDPLYPPPFALDLGPKVGGVPATQHQTDHDVSDQDSCYSVDLDRFLAIDMISDDMKSLASPKPDER